MNKHLKLVCVMMAAIAMFSSCKKKTTDLSILTGHKWVLSSDLVTFDDSTGIVHNQLAGDTGCQGSGYIEFHDYTSNDAVRLMYSYYSSTCQGQTGSPNVGVTGWNIDPDNTAILMSASPTDGTGGRWYNIKTLSSSSLVVTVVTSRYLGTTGAPHFLDIYDNQTETWTYGTK